MAKITYYLGAGASYNSCPVLEKQAIAMMAVATSELNWSKYTLSKFNIEIINFSPNEKNFIDNFDSKGKILWYIGYFGKQALKYNTIDTYAKKLQLSGTDEELRLLKMSVSVFFDLWENFQAQKYSHIKLDSEVLYKPIDQRYISLFSVLLERNGTKLEMNNSFKFITWNYDLQLESAFQSFMKEGEVSSLEELNQYHFPFMENKEVKNDVYHLNGHRGFFNDVVAKTDLIKRLEVKLYENYDKYWDSISWVYESALIGGADFHKYIKYAWEHDLNSDWFNKISQVMEETDILVVIGYSFPPFNRKIDQFLFNKLSDKVKIIYQDPNANEQIIKNLFTNPHPFKDKIIVEKELMSQFYLPNEHFIVQEDEQGFHF